MTEETGAKIIACIIVVGSFAASYGITELVDPGKGESAVMLFGAIYSVIITWLYLSNTGSEE